MMEAISDLQQIYLTLQSLLQHYSPPLTEKAISDRRYELWSAKAVVIEGRKRPEVFFAATIIQKAYVGFYFMPVYSDPDIKAFFQPELLKLLKGKSCFHVKRLDASLKGQIAQALQEGFALYQQRGWIDAPPAEGQGG